MTDILLVSPLFAFGSLYGVGKLAESICDGLPFLYDRRRETANNNSVPRISWSRRIRTRDFRRVNPTT
jgi:hypothetical protein